jgi:hypothetical protein
LLASTLFFIDIGLLLTVLELMIAVLTLIIGVLTMLASEGSTLPPSFQKSAIFFVEAASDGNGALSNTDTGTAMAVFIALEFRC